METADLPENYFDLAYSYMVMEHVADPVGFLKALVKCLQPGGVYVFLTPNKRHYFTITASFRVFDLGADLAIAESAN